MQGSCNSEVAWVRQQIELENQGARNGLYGAAIVASHEAITARMERMTARLQQLERTGKYEEFEKLLRSDDLWEIERRAD